MRPMTDRDVMILMLALIVAAGVGAIDYLIQINPSSQDSVLNAGFVFVVAWGFYRLRS